MMYAWGQALVRFSEQPVDAIFLTRVSTEARWYSLAKENVSDVFGPQKQTRPARLQKP